MNKKICLIIILFCLVWQVRGQLCTAPGQTPVSAILVCGAESFTVNTSTYCGQTNIPVPCPGGPVYQNINPNFFRMACYTSGTLGFIIAPEELSADYNWQLFDITNINPQDIFTDPSLFVACNWSSEPGETGASSDGTITTVCSGGGQPLFCKMPDITAGRTYLLMIINQSGSFSGYQLSLTGGTASITDAIEPHLQSARASCNGTQVIVRMNKKLQCGTLAPDGTDFTISSGAAILSAAPGDCIPLFGTDSVILNLDQALSIGSYTITMVNGTDGNTMTDVCNRNIAVGETIQLVVAPLQPTLLDSISPVKCAPGYLELVFKKPIRCNSIAPDGSDFIITGPQNVSSTVAMTACNNTGVISIIRLDLSSPLVVAGNYAVQLTTGSDGNTITDECGLASPPGSSVSFMAADTVSAKFTYAIVPSCLQTTVSFLHNNNNVTSWNWDFGNGQKNQGANPGAVSYKSGQYTVQLKVSNGSCSDTHKEIFSFNNDFSVSFTAPNAVCSGDMIHLTNTSKGNINNWQWSFGDGNTSTDKNPATFQYPLNGNDISYTIRLIASNEALNCRDTVTQVIRVVKHCSVAVPSAFSPNSDGKNDYLYPLNASKADNIEFKVYNRTGQVVFISKDATTKWDGKINGQLQPMDVYVWVLSFTDHDTSEKVFMKGTVLLLR